MSGCGAKEGATPALRRRVAVLASGRGSNFVAVAAAVARGDLPVHLAVVISDVADAPVRMEAERRGIPFEFVDPLRAVDADGRYRRKRYGELLRQVLVRREVDYVALAGFMRLLGGAVLEQFRRRIVNIHPSLLPAFPGLDAQAKAWHHGVAVAGCTVHFVDDGVDTGPIIAQRAVPVRQDDTIETLSRRILAAEHDLYWRALKQLVTHDVHIEGRRVVFAPQKAKGANGNER